MLNFHTALLLVAAALCASSCAHRPAAMLSGADANGAAPGSEQARPGSQEDFALNVGDRVFFEYAQSTLGPEARAVLQRQAAWLQRFDNVGVTVAGNCDERGTREYNLALGAQRAAAVRDYLVSLGVAPNRVQTLSYGKDRPIDARPNAEGWAVNRNAQTLIANAPTS